MPRGGARPGAGRYEVSVCGVTVSRHRTERAAQAAAERVCRESGLVDDGAYSGDAGWPSITDTAEPWRRVDYEVVR